MIQKQTVLKLGDNSGVRFVKCIHVYNSQIGTINSSILATVKNVKSYDKIKKGDLFKCIVIRLKCKKHRKTGNSILFNENTVVLLNKKNEFYGTRVFGPICNELRKKNFLKLLSLGSVII